MVPQQKLTKCLACIFVKKSTSWQLRLKNSNKTFLEMKNLVLFDNIKCNSHGNFFFKFLSFSSHVFPVSVHGIAMFVSFFRFWCWPTQRWKGHVKFRLMARKGLKYQKNSPVPFSSPAYKRVSMRHFSICGRSFTINITNFFRFLD